MSGRVGRVFRQIRVHVVPGLGALDKDVGRGAKLARIVEGADANGDEVGPGRDPQKQHRAAIRAEGAGDLVAAVGRPEVELGFALGDPEARRRNPPSRGKGAAALALAVAAMAQQRKAGLASEVLAAIQQLAGAGMTMVVVTHEMSFARDIADRILFMDAGIIVEEGKPDDLLFAPQSERVRTFLRRYNDRYRI